MIEDYRVARAKSIVIGVVIILCLVATAWSDWLDHQPTLAQPADAQIETHNGTDYVVLDHDGTHYVIELGGTQ